MEPSGGDRSVGAEGSALLTLVTLRPSDWSKVMLSLSVERMFTAYVLLSIEEFGSNLIVKV